MAPKVKRMTQVLSVDEKIQARFGMGHKYVIVELDESEKPTRIVSSSPDEEVARSTLSSLISQHPEANLRIVKPHAWKKDSYTFVKE